MKQIRALYYIGTKRPLNNLIQAWTWPFNLGTIPTSHTETWTRGEVLPFENPAWYCLPTLDKSGDPVRILGKLQEGGYVGTCWTSTMIDDHDGTVKRPAAEVLKHPEHWCYQPYEVEDDDYAKGVDYMQEEVDGNQGYAKKDLCKFLPVLRHFIKDKLRNICSEFVHNVKVMFGLLPGPFKVVCPRKLWKMLVKKHHKPTYHLSSGKMIHDGRKFVKGWRKMVRAEIKRAAA